MSNPGTAPDVEHPTAAERLAVALLLGSTFVVILNETIMGVALPRLMTDLRVGPSTAQWLTAAFMLTMAVVIPVSGFVIRRYRTRTVFVTSMALFSAGTAIAAVAPGFGVLLVGRVVQASGTALMLPLLMTTVMTVTPPATRGRTMGRISVVISVAPALGPTLSGLILSVLAWRWMFGLVLPVALLALLLGAVRMPDVTTPERPRVDWLSVPLAALGFGGLVLALSSFGTGAGLASWATLVVGGAGLSLFAARQIWLARTDDALLDLRVLQVPAFAAGMVLMAMFMATMFGVIILVPLYAQQVLGVDVLTTGLVLAPGGLLMGLVAPAVGRAYDRYGARVLLVPGSVVTSLAAWGFTLLPTGGSPWPLLACHVALSLGLALVFTPLFTSSLGALPPNRYGYGSAMVGTVQQVAGAAGTALFVTVLAAQAAAGRSGGASTAAATAGGIHSAFVVGAVLATLTVAGCVLLRTTSPTRTDGPTDGPTDAPTPETTSDAAVEPGQAAVRPARSQPGHR